MTRSKIAKLRPIFKYHGGKYYVCDFIIKHFPQNYEQMEYIEPFCGGCSIILNKKPSVKETIADVDSDLITTINSIVRDNGILRGVLSAEEYCEKTFNYWRDLSPVPAAFIPLRTYIVNRMSRGGLGKTFAWSDRLRNGKPGDVNAWETSLENFPAIANRLQQVRIEKCHFKSIHMFGHRSIIDNPNVFTYLDPPYLHSTRTAKSAYKYEMTAKDHVDLLDIIRSFKGKVLISGYHSELYNNYLADWNRYEKDVPNNSGQNKVKQRRTEVLWANY